MYCSTTAKSYSYARIVFALGAGSVESRAVERGQEATFDSAWHCGCHSHGPYCAMVWTPCQAHGDFASTLDEEKTSLLLSLREPAEA
jgi:hypothetical protein